MGASVDEGVGHRSFGGRTYLELVLGKGSEGVHRGCVLGRCWGVDHDDPARRAESRETWWRWSCIAGIAVAIEDSTATIADLDIAFASFTGSLSVGPWPGVSPAAWWSTLLASERAGFARAIADAALSARVCA